MISKFILIFAFIHQIFANFIIYIENPCIVVFNKQYNDDIMKIIYLIKNLFWESG